LETPCDRVVAGICSFDSDWFRVELLGCPSRTSHKRYYVNLARCLSARRRFTQARKPKRKRFKAYCEPPENLARTQPGRPIAGPSVASAVAGCHAAHDHGQRRRRTKVSDASGDKGILAQRFRPFSLTDPWQRVDSKLLHTADRPTLGPTDAPVKIVEFADFECPYCAKAFNEIETLVNTTYKGQVQLIWKAFPLQGHTWAEQAAIAAECVKEQNPQAFWTIAGDFYRDQNEITPQNLRDHIYSYAGSAGIDPKALNACILGSTAEARVDEDKKDGSAMQVMSTPTFVINGVPVVGLPTSNVFDFVITSQLQSRHASR
jgi:protein-disulfide isomerase